MAQSNGTAVRGYTFQSVPSLDMRETRRLKGLTLEDIADRTKISIRFLRAIEADEFDKLPGGIFTTSYLRQYAAVVGIEEAKMLLYYESKRMGAGDEAAAGSEREPASEGILMRFWRASATAGR